MTRKKKSASTAADAPKFPRNGEVTDVVERGSLLHMLYSGYSPMSENEYYRMKEMDTAYVNSKGVIHFDGVHVFAKCNNSECHVCLKYKNSAIFPF